MKTYDVKRMRADIYSAKVFKFCAGILAIIIIALIFFMAQQGLKTFGDVSFAEFFLSSKWSPDTGQYGAASFIVGSLLVTFFATIIGGPLGILGAIFIVKLAPKWSKEFLQVTINLYMAIPSVVYGFLGLTVVVPFVRKVFDVPGGFGLFTASIILAIMILPTVIGIAADALKTVPVSLEEASYGLGATYWQTIWNVILPTALPGLITAIILGMARAIGETMAVQMVIGNTPQLTFDLFTPTTTLPSEIVVEMGNTPFGSTWGNSLFMMALVLLLISVFMILVVRKISSLKEVK